jgi:uridine kinase
MKIITISGLSGSGKTTLAYELKNKIANSEVISLDDYVYSKEYLIDKYNNVDFSNPKAFNQTLFNENINTLKKKGLATIPKFNLITKVSKNINIRKPKILLVEGMFAQIFSKNLHSLDIYIRLDLDIALIRKIKRDTKERNRDIEFIIDEHLNYTRKNSQLVISQQERCLLSIDNNKSDNDFILNDILELINE